MNTWSATPLAAAALLAAAPASALQPIEAFLAGARSYSADNKEARANLAQQQAEVGVARGKVLPGLSLSGSYTRNQYESTVTLPGGLGVPPTFITVTPKDQLNGAATLTVPLIDLAGWKRAEAARTSADASDAQARATALGTEGQVAQTYYQLLANMALVGASQRALDVAKVSLRIAEDRRAAGAAALLDVDRARAELESDFQQLAAADLQVSIAARALASLTGVTPDVSSGGSLGDDLHEEAPLERFDPGGERVPSLVAARRSRTAAEEQAAAQKLTLVPDVTGSFTEQATNAGGFVGHDAAWQGVVALRWSFDFGTVPGIRSQEAAADAARAREQRAELAARDAIANAWNTVRTNIARSRSARTQAEVSAEAAQQALERYRAGTASQLDLLQAQRDAFAAEASRIQADANLVNARAQLRTATGTSLLEASAAGAR
jgi:outer membrane protein TolC